MKIPKSIVEILQKLAAQNFAAWLVGGCVRDLLMKNQPTDWDVATDARPAEIMKIFADAKYENDFGTVLVKLKTKNEKLKTTAPACHRLALAGRQNSKLDETNNAIKTVEITTFRKEADYQDGRHPQKVEFTDELEEDLARRDFTVNAMALRPKIKKQESRIKKDKKTESIHNLSFIIHDSEIVDLFGGQDDLKKKIIKTVGEPDKRFGEDALRLMRAVRFACQLGFVIKEKTQAAIKKNAALLQKISQERIRDELTKIVMSERAEWGIGQLHALGLLGYILPELGKGVGVAQNRHHVYEVFEHNVRSLGFAAQKKFSLVVRLAALLHDVAKPQTKEGEGPEATFHNHEYAGARMAFAALDRLRFPKEIGRVVRHLIRYHMFVYDVGAVSEAGVRRLVKRIGPENLDAMFDLRVADRLGSGCPKAVPYKLRHLRYMMDKVARDPISVKMLKVNGHDIIKTLDTEPGPKVGAILDVLLAEVIEDPKRNTKKYLEPRVRELDKENLDKLRQMAKSVIEEKREEDDQKIKEKYWVK